MASATGDSARQSGFNRQAATTNTSDANVTNATASPGVIAPRGSSRLAVRGLSASIRASTRRLNPIAALRADTMATRIQRRGAPTNADSVRSRTASSAPASANGSAKTEWLKRTNEPYVRTRSSMIEPPDLRWLNAPDQIFFHIVAARRHVDGNQPGALAGVEGSEVGAEAERSGALARCAVDQFVRLAVRRESPHRRQFREDVEVVDAREAVGADGDADARLVEARDRRRAGARVQIAARTGDERRPARGKRSQIGVRHLHAVDRQRARTDESDVVEKLDRRARWRRPGRIPHAEILEQRAPRPASRADELDFLDGLREMDAADRKSTRLNSRPP